ncbi:MFS general substrate transporter [Yamadazyma tenuis ATCC 10573]|uniref:MFS general substrate transporter n=2 Tax=Candida tenuis (strain ATCC 10573 / BCRC 21748 / CBS 615 / JCM 9827 / NBRC 10315 / NRRL Y-1498 / VKM Y-70) TaxID=590646 RepID=G3B1V6_CANTC|nr:MFS general substrate transporter [Yamadazyma tenuis ATCC 10573]EGV65017.1 MFS general substrate transporter [Yamadazyma tenuis ATCC 10573]
MSVDKTNEVVIEDITHSDSLGNQPHLDHYIYNAEERKARLTKPHWKDIMSIVCAGFALISDGYQNNVLTMVNQVLTQEFPKEYTADMKTNVSNAGLITTIFGQVIIGIYADYIGRKNAIVVATVFLVVGTCLCAASHGNSVNGLLWMLIISRGVTGFGIGAEYPSCSVSANEAANESVKKRGGIFVLVTNLPLSLGGPFALIIFLIVYQITSHYEGIWRTMFAIGAFWPLSVFYFRMKMATSELYKKSAIKKNIPYWLAIKFYWKRLIGTCVCWFLYDFVTFPNGIFSAGIISSILIGPDASNLEKIAEWTLLLGSIAIPGCFIGAYLCDVIGRKYTLMTGFLGYIVFGLIVGIGYDKISKIVPLFVVFYGLMQSCGNLGPGNMLGLISSECYATPVRGTFYGFSAAIGKVGAVVGTKTFTPIQNNVHLGKKWTFIIAAICGLVGVVCAFVFVPHLKEDDLLEEDIKFKNYLRDNGWTGDFGNGEQVDDYDAASSESALSNKI